MRVFVYEFLTGGGWRAALADEPPPSLLAEGLAMVRAVAADLQTLPGVDVRLAWDAGRLAVAPSGVALCPVDSPHAEHAILTNEAAGADWTLIVAPETYGWLAERSDWVRQAGGRPLGPTCRAIGLCADKHALAEHLAARGVRVPVGILLEPGNRLPPDFPLPAVVKPIDGCGSLGVRRLDRREQLDWPVKTRSRAEAWCAGLPCSVAQLCGPDEAVALTPCRQRLGGASGLEYLGGALPLAAPLAARATQLAAAAVACVAGLLGYVGVDLVLGAAADGSQDVAIEINPRLTTSYVGLRSAARTNLAGAMLAAAAGQQPAIEWREGAWQFDADGTVRSDPPP